ncbi:type 2 glycerol-3-phosphate oxidase [[Mycoplasma] mobile]|uniref:Glycerol-3-phosphate dehydrogenase n=1 Tax=Mycoplasma mobile (strain ATCC 43663 / 163K / NCTC 11711) TaxID=267748 RepID=Q6KHZ5_MYCM1|nr:type 2 glycerol-3-phosphate oxidase [[Mycoplasma] mobile]AAT27781.1 glycerol-3-phosphate dehydrogenase [Mycoplasma mobile 163K]
MKKYDVIVIGGGIIGGAITYQLSKYNLKIAVLEKNPILAGETSAANSGVLHGGFDPEPHKIEARLNVEGVKIWKEQIFKHLIFNRAKLDTLVLAFNDEELKELKKLYDRGLENNVPKEFMKIISMNEIISREPHVNKEVKSGLVYNDSWAIDPIGATKAFFGVAKQNGVEIHKNSKVTKIKYENDLFSIQINDKDFLQAKVVINAAGHYSDEIAKIAGYPDFKLTTRRGEYRILSNSELSKVNSILFMVPTIHGKGVVVAPMLDGRVMTGPSAEDGVEKNDTRLITREKFEFIERIGKKLIPSLDFERTELTFSGSRAIDIATNDFIINSAKENINFINAAGMQSPAIAAAPAIALEIEKLVKKTKLKLEHKKDFNPNYEVIF